MLTACERDYEIRVDREIRNLRRQLANCACEGTGDCVPCQDRRTELATWEGADDAWVD